MDKKIYKYIIFLVILIVLLFLFVWISRLFSGNSVVSYESLEKKIVDAARKYSEEHSSILPVEPGTSTVVSSTVLINNNYIDNLSEYVNNSNVTCNGKVEIYMTEEDYYNYVPTINCGSEYNTIKLSEQVILDNNYGVVSGDGLYERANGKFITDYNELGIESENYEYVFRGDSVNNYVKIDENVWRIVAIKNNGDILLIYTGSTQKPSAWDDRYNEDVKKNQGINNYEYNNIKSRAMESVLNFYDGKLTLMNKEEYSLNTKYLTVPMNLCIGKRNTTDSDFSGKIECSLVLENQYIGLLPAYYYMSASLDDGCDSTTSKNCGNYNYLSYFDDYWWLLTANNENTNEAFYVSNKFITTALCSSRNSIRPIIMLGSRAVYNSGIGTEDEPYTIKIF